MNVLIIGSEGAQGKRYQAILKSLGVEFGRLDAKYFDTACAIFELFTHFIIATPTETHAEIIRELLPLNKSILCEKPITKDIFEMRDLYEEIKRSNVSFSMVYQYRHLVLDGNFSGDSSYNYFRHGNDGLTWDCLQIIGLGNGAIDLSEKSPVWKCQINGEPLFIEEMDSAYVLEVQDWLNDRGFNDLDSILNIHEKVNTFADRQCITTTTQR